MTPKTAALRYRIWAYASPKGWDCTYSEVAEHTGVSTQTVVNLARHAGWLERFRGVGHGPAEHAFSASSMNVSGVRAMAADIVAGRIGYAP